MACPKDTTSLETRDLSLFVMEDVKSVAKVTLDDVMTDRLDWRYTRQPFWPETD